MTRACFPNSRLLLFLTRGLFPDSCLLFFPTHAFFSHVPFFFPDARLVFFLTRAFLFPDSCLFLLTRSSVRCCGGVHAGNHETRMWNKLNPVITADLRCRRPSQLLFKLRKGVLCGAELLLGSHTFAAGSDSSSRLSRQGRYMFAAYLFYTRFAESCCKRSFSRPSVATFSSAFLSMQRK